MEKEILAVAALKEANELLQDTITRHRRTIKMLRTINRRLRALQAIAHANDEEFKASCAEVIYEQDEVEGGFPDTLSS